MTYKTIRSVDGPTRTEIEKIKGSRFLVDVAPAADEGAALGFVEEIRLREPQASHHCWAYRLGDGRERSSDDGEPGGTAGPPILQRIVRQDLYELVVVVTRYYGGTNLGTGGLMRAYGAAAAAGLSAAIISETIVTTSVSFRYPYPQSAAVEATIAAHDGVIAQASYTDEVLVTVAIPTRAVGAFLLALNEATSGQVGPSAPGDAHL